MFFKRRLMLGSMGAGDCNVQLQNVKDLQAWCNAPGKKDRDTSACAANIAAANSQYTSCMAANAQSVAAQITTQPVSNSLLNTLNAPIGGSPVVSPSGVVTSSGGIPTWMLLVGGAVALGAVVWMVKRKKK
jgi:LPXTG-motif cell wall-anchored protein